MASTNLYDDANRRAHGNGPRHLTGRREIRHSVSEITFENVAKVVSDVRADFAQYKDEVLWLWDYYRGAQTILNRRKSVRPEITDNVVVNHANEIVSFKVGYQFGEPVQYVGRNESEDLAQKITSLNDMMYSVSKASEDRNLAEWYNVCGTAYRMVLPQRDDDAPYRVFTLDPSTTFVIYSTDYTHRPLGGVIVTYTEEGNEVYTVYTPSKQFIVNNGMVGETPNPLGYIPIIEYKANNARLGAFETVIPLLDSINTVASNRVEAVEQFVQAITVMYNIDITEEGWDALREKGLLKLKSQDGVLKPDVKMLTSELNQSQTQTLVDYMYETVLTICGIPSKSAAQGSDTGAAVLLRDGWSIAEARAKDEEWMFKQAESQFLRIVFRILREKSGVELSVKDVDVHFTRRNFDNLLTKSEFFATLMATGWVAPLDAFRSCGIFSDPEEACIAGTAFHEENAVEETAQQAVTASDTSFVPQPTE